MPQSNTGQPNFSGHMGRSAGICRSSPRPFWHPQDGSLVALREKRKNMVGPAVRSSATAAETPPGLPPRAAVGLIPGVLLLAVVGYAGKFIEQFIASYGKAHHLVLPNIEYVLWAILIGLAMSNTVGIAAIFRSGVATYEFSLKAGIVLLGARFLLGDVRRLGGLSLVLIAIELVLSLTFMTYLGRAFKLKPKLISLLAIESSICGVSAIIAAQGAIDADAAGSDLSFPFSADWTLFAPE
jgi:hypothetical protein